MVEIVHFSLHLLQGVVEIVVARNTVDFHDFTVRGLLNVPLKRGAQVAVSRGLHLKSKLVDARSRVHVSFQENRDVFDL